MSCYEILQKNNSSGSYKEFLHSLIILTQLSLSFNTTLEHDVVCDLQPRNLWSSCYERYALLSYQKH